MTASLRLFRDRDYLRPAAERQSPRGQQPAGRSSSTESVHDYGVTVTVRVEDLPALPSLSVTVTVAA
jgi:hypothetical protein